MIPVQVNHHGNGGLRFLYLVLDFMSIAGGDDVKIGLMMTHNKVTHQFNCILFCDAYTTANCIKTQRQIWSNYTSIKFFKVVPTRQCCSYQAYVDHILSRSKRSTGIGSCREKTDRCRLTGRSLPSHQISHCGTEPGFPLSKKPL